MPEPDAAGVKAEGLREGLRRGMHLVNLAEALVSQVLVTSILAASVWLAGSVLKLPYSDVGQLLFRDVSLYVLFVGFGIASTLVWQPFAVRDLIRALRTRRANLAAGICARLVATVIVIPTIGLIALLALRGGAFQNRQARLLFPELWRLGPTTFGTYCSNGEVQLDFVEANRESGPSAYQKIMIRLKDERPTNACGWVIYFPHGVSVAGRRVLRFMIKGERGGEAIGLKAKDAAGAEVTVAPLHLLQREPLPEGRITTSWQQITVDLRSLDVDWDFMDNISVFTSGELARTDWMTVYVGSFELQ